MDYIYCAVFSDATVKFGRSVDVWKRLYSLDAESKRFGNSVKHCFLSTVFDSVRDERNLLEHAGEMLEVVSRESFKAESTASVAEVYHAARVPFMFCEMSDVAFGPMITKNSFSTNFDMASDKGGFISKPTRKDRVEARILKLIDTYSGPVTRSIFKNRLLNYPDFYVDEALSDMIGRGILSKEPHPTSQCGFKYVRAIP